MKVAKKNDFLHIHEMSTPKRLIHELIVRLVLKGLKGTIEIRPPINPNSDFIYIGHHKTIDVDNQRHIKS